MYKVSRTMFGANFGGGRDECDAKKTLHTQKSLDSQLTLFANTLMTLIEVLQILIHETFQ